MPFAEFKKRPLVVEAALIADIIEAWREDPDSLPEWFLEARQGDVVHVKPDGVHVATKEGMMFGGPDSYLIRGVKGELYPCGGDVFSETYVPVKKRAKK